MIGAMLFVAAGLSYLLANYWREKSVSADGAVRPDRRTAYLMLNTVCLTVAAALVAAVQMITQVVPA
jgi:hypothetical protein